MTEVEREICSKLGISEADYLRTKRTQVSVNGGSLAAGIRLSKTERAICQNLGTSPMEYLASKARRLLLVSVSASRRGFNGRQALDEMADAMYESGELPHHKDAPVRPEALVEHGQAEMYLYTADPDADDAWRHLARAIVFLEEAAQLRTPAYADRLLPSAAAEDEDDEGGNDAESAANPFDSSYRSVARLANREIERQLGPLLRAAGAPRPIQAEGKLSDTELAICHRMNITPTEYLKAKRARSGCRS